MTMAKMKGENVNSKPFLSNNKYVSMDCTFCNFSLELVPALWWCSLSLFVIFYKSGYCALQLINKFGYVQNTRSLLISLNMNIVKVNLSNNGLSLTNITKYKSYFQKDQVTTILKKNLPCPHSPKLPKRYPCPEARKHRSDVNN